MLAADMDTDSHDDKAATKARSATEDASRSIPAWDMDLDPGQSQQFISATIFIIGM